MKGLACIGQVATAAAQRGDSDAGYGHRCYSHAGHQPLMGGSLGFFCLLGSHYRDHVDDDQQQGDDQYYQGGDGVDAGVHTLTHGVDHDTQVLDTASGDEIGNDEIVDGHGESDQSTGEDAGHDLRYDDLGQSLPGSAAQIHGRVSQVGIQGADLGHDGQHYVRDAEGNVGQQHGHITLLDLEGDK